MRVDDDVEELGDPKGSERLLRMGSNLDNEVGIVDDDVEEHGDPKGSERLLRMGSNLDNDATKLRSLESMAPA